MKNEKKKPLPKKTTTAPKTDKIFKVGDLVWAVVGGNDKGWIVQQSKISGITYYTDKSGVEMKISGYSIECHPESHSAINPKCVASTQKEILKIIDGIKKETRESERGKRELDVCFVDEAKRVLKELAERLKEE